MPVSRLATDNYDRYASARDNGHLDYVAKARKCNRFFAGQQWDQNVQRR